VPDAVADRLAALRQLSEPQLAGLLAAVPGLAEAVEGRGPLTPPAPWSPRGGARAAGPLDLDGLARVLAGRAAIDRSLATLDRPAWMLAVLAAWHGGPLTRDHGLHGVRRGTRWRTTRPDPTATRAPDLVDREFTAPAPNRLWVADFTYVRTHVGLVYAAFVIDVFSRRIVGWSLATHMRTELPLEVLQMALWTRHGQPLDGLVHHSDPGRSTPRSATPTGSQTPAWPPRSGRSATPTTTPWPRPPSACTRPSSSHQDGPGAPPTSSSSRPWSGSTGSTTADSTRPSATSHPPSTRPTTTHVAPRRPQPEPTEPSLHQTRGVSIARPGPPAGCRSDLSGWSRSGASAAPRGFSPTQCSIPTRSGIASAHCRLAATRTAEPMLTCGVACAPNASARCAMRIVSVMPPARHTHPQLPRGGRGLPEHGDEPLHRPTPQAVAIDDYNADNFDHTGLGFILGGTIGLENKLQPIGAANAVPQHRPQWGRGYKEYLLEHWNHIAFVRAQPEPLSYVGNHLDLDPRASEPGPGAHQPRAPWSHPARRRSGRPRLLGPAGGHRPRYR